MRTKKNIKKRAINSFNTHNIRRIVWQKVRGITNEI